MACVDHKYERGAYGVCRRCGGEDPRVDPKRLYETERKRKWRERLYEGRTNRVAVYLTDEDYETLREAYGDGDLGDDIANIVQEYLYVYRHT